MRRSYRKNSRWDILSKYWKLQEEPLSPSLEDLQVVDFAVSTWFEKNKRAPQVLILGVTPQFLRINWPKGTKISAIDRSKPMIDLVWPGKKKDAILGDWCSMNVASNSIDIVLCDGGFSFLDYPDSQKLLVDQLARILTIGGFFIGRYYIPPKRKEKVDEIVTDLRSGNIRNVAVLKMRLAKSLQRTPKNGVVLQDVWNVLEFHCPNLRRLAKRLGWKIGTLATLEHYKNNKMKYYFPNLTQVDRLFRSTGAFRVVKRVQPSHQIGEESPTVIFERVEK